MSMPLPRLTPEGLRDAVVEMCEQANQMVQLAREGFRRASSSPLEQVHGLGRELHLREKRLTEHVAMELREYPWSLGSSEHLAFLPAALERIGDSVEALARCAQSIHREGIPYSERAFAEALELFQRSAGLLEGIAAVIRTGDRERLAGVQDVATQLEAFCDEVAQRHEDRLLKGICVPRASSVFLAMLDSFREITRYVRRMGLTLEKALASS